LGNSEIEHLILSALRRELGKKRMKMAYEKYEIPSREIIYV
jgi:hypothetical protein